MLIKNILFLTLLITLVTVSVSANQVIQTSVDTKILFDAILKNDLERAIKAIDDGADVNMHSQYLEYGVTPLHCAVQMSNPSMIEMLINRGAQVASKDSSDATPLHDAARDGHLAIIEILLKAGADVNAQDDHGWSPLHWATRSGCDSEVVKLLFDYKANPDILDNDGRTPFLMSLQKVSHEHPVELEDHHEEF